MIPAGVDPEALASVGTATTDPLLRALERAIYLEEVLGAVLPDDVLNDRDLGTTDAALATILALRSAEEDD